MCAVVTRDNDAMQHDPASFKNVATLAGRVLKRIRRERETMPASPWLFAGMVEREELREPRGT
jgi:hypothetical protein